MPKRYKKSRKNTRRKRTRRKYNPHAPLATGRLYYFKHKCTEIVPVESSGIAEDYATICAARFKPYSISGGSVAVYGFNNTTRYRQVYQNYE